MTQAAQKLNAVVKDYSESEIEQVINFAIRLRKEPEDQIIEKADRAAAETSERLTHEEVFAEIREAINARR